MKQITTKIPDVIVFEPDVHGDRRGYFMETWREEWFTAIDENITFVQDNQSKSVKGALRGLHYQVKNPQGKYIRVIKGAVYDAVVDLRRSSGTFGQWVGETLSESNRLALWVPPGFAHGFYVLSEEAEIIYKCTDYYAAEHERTLVWNDPQVGIAWPLDGDDLILSEKDKQGTTLSQSETFA